MQFGFHILNHAFLTESHVTKNDFFSSKKIENFDITFFYIAYDDFNDIYDDMNPSLYCLSILLA